MKGEDQRRDREERHEPHAPYEWHEPMHDEQEHTHAGNGTVNDGPDELAPESPGSAGRDAAGSGSAGSAGESTSEESTSEESSTEESTSEGSGTRERGAGGSAPDGREAGGPDSERTGRPQGLIGLPGFGGLTGLAGPGGREDRGHDRDDHDHDHDTPAHDGSGLDSPGLDGLDPDELVLRSLLHGAVEDVQPRDGVLEHLRRAVPARRARKRQALVGMAAAVLFVGTAVPALLHVSHVTGSDADPSMAGNASQAQGGAGRGENPDGGSGTSGGDGGRGADDGGSGGQKGDLGKGSHTGGGSGDGTRASASPGTSASRCDATALSLSTAVDSPDSAGIVYGTFRVGNMSAADCMVNGVGEIATAALGAADATKITVVRHTSGDAATGLPDPSAESDTLLLRAASFYKVNFAVVPSQTCPTDGGTGGGTGGTETGAPSPDPSTSADTGTTDATGGGNGTTSQLLTEDGTTDGSVVLTYTTVGGAQTTATVPSVCAATVYRTGLLAT
jgi:hypothetical protein